MSKKGMNAALLVVVLLIQPAWSQAQLATGISLHYLTRPFVHPGMMQDRRDLDFMKRQVMSGKAPWKEGFDNLKKEASLSFIARPYTHVFEGAYGAHDHGGSSLMRSAAQSYDDALIWYITGDRRYARKAIAILNAWSYRLWDFDGNNAKLLAGLSGYYFLNAAEILRYSHAGWVPRDIAAFGRLMLTVYYPLIRNFFTEANGNWDASMINTMLCIGVFTDNHAIFNRAVRRYYLGHGNSGVIRYIYPSGQIQEATRDWGHVQLGIGELAKAAQVAWTQGIDFYGAADDRLALGFEYTARYMLGGEVPVYGVISPRGRGMYKDRDIYEGIYDHYHRLKGFSMPYTAEVILRHTRPASSVGVLTGLRAPVTPRPTTFRSLAASPAAVLEAGAASSPVTPPFGRASVVGPGASIQAALDSLQGRKGCVVLAKGVHILRSPLKIPSDVTLCGMGKATVLFLDPRLSGYAIVNADDSIHDVTLRDFVVEGATSTQTHPDPNDDRRKRSYMSAPSRGGIRFAGAEKGQMHDIRLEHVTVQHCTLAGVMMSGATSVVIDSCDISDNGSSVVPGAGLHDDVQLSHVGRCRVTASRLDDSPWGSGLAADYVTACLIRGNETARNGASGIRCMQSDSIKIIRNTAEGNGGDGISADTVTGIPGEIWVRENTARDNDRYGILVRPAGRAVGGNEITDNGIEQGQAAGSLR